MEVQGHGGIVLGFVRQLWHPFLPRFTVQTHDGQDALFIHGPFCVCSCNSDVKFKVIIYIQYFGTTIAFNEKENSVTHFICLLPLTLGTDLLL